MQHGYHITTTVLLVSCTVSVVTFPETSLHESLRRFQLITWVLSCNTCMVCRDLLSSVMFLKSLTNQKTFHFRSDPLAKRLVYRSFQPNGFSKWPFLHYEESSDEVFCHMCLMACKLNRMKTGYVDPAFVSCCLVFTFNDINFIGAMWVL